MDRPREEVVLADLPDGLSVISVMRDGEHAYEIRRDGDTVGHAYSLRQVRVLLATLAAEAD